MAGAFGFTVSSRLDTPAVHKRRVDPADGGCVLTHEISFVPRLRITGPLYLAVVRRLFRHRHRRLRRMFGGSVLVEP